MTESTVQPDTQSNTQPNTAQPDMNLEPLETFVTDMALVLAGVVTQSDEAEGLSAAQLGPVFFSAVASRALSLPDYNPETDISSVIQLGVAMYGEAVYASVAASLARAEEQLTQNTQNTPNTEEQHSELLA